MWFALFYKAGPQILQTNWFIASVITEIALLFSIRTMLPIGKGGAPAPSIIWLSVLAFLSTITLPLIPLTAHYFEFSTPSLKDYALIISLTIVYLFVTEMVKRPMARFLGLTPPHKNGRIKFGR